MQLICLIQKFQKNPMNEFTHDKKYKNKLLCVYPAKMVGYTHIKQKLK